MKAVNHSMRSQCWDTCRSGKIWLRTKSLAVYTQSYTADTRLQSHSRHGHSRSGYSTVTADNEVKPFSAVPGPLLLPFIGNLYNVPKILRQKNIHILTKQHFDKYGPIYKNQWGPSDAQAVLSIADADILEALHRSEGKYPRRLIVDAWQNWRDEQGLTRGILVESDDQAWKKMRRQLDKQMLLPRYLGGYSEKIREVAADFLERIRTTRDSDSRILSDLSGELFSWSLETIGTILYEKRFGCLSSERSPDSDRFIQAVSNMFLSTRYVGILPRRINKKIMPRWQRIHDDAWAVIFEQGKKEIDARLGEIQQALSEGQQVSGFLSHLLASGVLSLDEIYGNISELMAAAVDTTSNTMLWAIYELSMRPDIQATLRDEVLSVASRGSVPTHQQIQDMTYLRGFIKEILRLYPVSGVETRISSKDLVLGGYHIPADIKILGHVHLLGRNSAYYPDPDTLRPERWLRSDDNKHTHSFAWLPFSFGPRMCIGRRIAELELHILTAVLVQEFDIVATESQPNPISTQPLLVPERPVRVRFTDRV